MSAERTEASVALIEWERLSLKDWRGNLTSYEIVYYEVLEEQCPLFSPLKFNPMNLSVAEPGIQINTENTTNVTLAVLEGSIKLNITDLEPVVQYCVSVAARTSAGIGELSYFIILRKCVHMLYVIQK